MISGKTYVHYIVENDKCGAFRLLFISYSYLAYAAITPKEVVQIFPSNLVVQILDKKYSIGTWGQFGLPTELENKH